ncbi:yeats family-domain-containing protein [Phascolomyces articulosus]|uniref:Yeats family-domain-containing protein n=1 Tax=Phascolomyces articulosus TaxID=60185 RepID=A0AAD5PDB8_9FUNG|nr:yeats family-domain-containing protein [Phascolomyces articulosus]
MELTQDIKITCQNSIIKGVGAQTFEGHPLRNWKIKLVAVDNGKEKKGRLSELLDHVEYILHPTFKDPRRVVTKEPYLLTEKGWGEFDMRIVLYFVNNIANTELLSFDLNFMQTQYSVVKTVVFQNPSSELTAILSRDPAPLPPAKKRRSNSTEKTRKSTTRSPISPKMTMDSLSGTSLSPSTPHLQQQQAISGGRGTYSASPQPNSFTSPSNGVLNSPYDYTQNIKTPQAAGTTNAEYESLNSYMSDISDDTRSRPALQQQQPTATGGGGRHSSGSSYEDGEDRYNRRRKSNNNNNNNNSSNNNSNNKKLNGHRGHSSSSSDTNGDDKNDDDEHRIVDDVYSESDLDHINPIHGEPLSSDLRRAWGIPENVNMLELAKKISSLDNEKLAEIRSIVDRYKTDGMGVSVEDNEVVVDLYSLGPDLLTRLWNFTHY